MAAGTAKRVMPLEATAMLDFFKGTVTRQDGIFVGVVIAIAVLLGAGFYFVVFKAQKEKLETMTTAVGDVEGQLEIARHIDDNYADFERKMTNMEDLVTKFQDRLPEERNIGRLIGNFERQGSDLGLLVTLEPQGKISEPAKVTYPYKVTVKGDYHDIVTFINLFERDERYIKVNKLVIKEQKVVDGQLMTEASFTLSTFVFKQEAAAAGDVS